MVNEYGVWSEQTGGFILTGCHGDAGKAEAEQYIADALQGRDDSVDPDEAADCTVTLICPDHEEQPATGCDECDADDDDDDDAADED